MKEFLSELDIKHENSGTSTGQDFLEDDASEKITSYTPSDGSEIAVVYQTTKKEYEEVVRKSQEAFKEWRMMPAPERG